jgi:Tfp pilus assembly protein PilO
MAEQKKMSEREKLLTYGGAALVIAYVFYQFLLTPTLTKIGQSRETLKTKRLELKMTEDQIKLFNVIAGRMPKADETPREEKALTILKLISLATNRSGLMLDFIKPLPDESGDDFKFTLSCSGSYRELYSFLFILNHLKIVILVDDIEITSSGGHEPVLTAKVDLTAHY